MSGVQVGTRLAQLRELHARIGHEIAAEERRVALDGGRRRVGPDRPRMASQPSTPEGRLAALGVTARQVKEWAVTVGLAARVTSGRVSGELVDAYATCADRTTP